MKFIGDFDKLKDYGFKRVNDLDITMIRPVLSGSGNTFIRHNREVLCWREEYIQDLIKDGLVIKEE